MPPELSNPTPQEVTHSNKFSAFNFLTSIVVGHVRHPRLSNVVHPGGVACSVNSQTPVAVTKKPVLHSQH